MIVNLPNFKVAISENASKKIYAATMSAKGEVSGLAKVKKIGNRFVIVDSISPEQTNSEAYTEIGSKQLSRLLITMAKQNVDSSDWHCWWHSHSYMQCCFSGTDTDTIKRLVRFGSKPFYLISIVVNKFWDMICRVDVDSLIKFTILNVDVNRKQMIEKREAVPFYGNHYLLGSPPTNFNAADSQIKRLMDGAGIF